MSTTSMQRAAGSSASDSPLVGYPRRFLFRPTLVGILTIGLALMVSFAAMNTGNNLIYLLASLLLSAVICSLVIGRRSLRSLELKRVMPPEVSCGWPATVVLRVTSRRRHAKAYAVTVVDGALCGRDRMMGRAFAPIVKPGETVRLSYEITPPRRGEYRFREALLASSYPFGLFACLRRFDLPDSMIVYPRLGRLSQELIHLGRSCGAERIMQSNKRLGADEFYGIRDYRPGDNPRHIHWRTSARASKWMLKEFEREEPLASVLVLDSFADVENEESLDRFELAISLAATWIDELSRRGARVSLVAAMRHAPAVSNGERLGISAEIMRELALLDPAREEDASRLQDAVLSHTRAGSHVTAILLGADSPLRACLRAAQSRGAHVEAMNVSDPRIAAGFEPNGGTSLPTPEAPTYTPAR